MGDFKGILFCIFLFISFAIASTDLFWFVIYLVACGIIWCVVHVCKWLNWLFMDDIQRMKRDKEKYYRQKDGSKH